MQIQVPGCDAANPSIYLDNDGNYICRCIVCRRCAHHTGNSNQGHYWKLCNVQMKFHDIHAAPLVECRQCLPEFHFCCPGDCELYNEDGSEKVTYGK